MSEDLKKLVETMIVETLQLRAVSDLPAPGSDPKHVLESLADTRGRLDRVEELLQQSIRMRYRINRQVNVIRIEYENLFDAALDKARTERGGPVVRTNDEYSSAKERLASANLATLEPRRALRLAEDVASYTDEALDVIRQAHRGLEGVRHDHLTLLRAVQFETTLDRG